MLESFCNLLESCVDCRNLVAVFVDVEKRDAADWNFQKGIHIVVGDFADKLLFERFESVFHGIVHILGGLHLLNLFVDSFLNKNALKGSCMKFLSEFCPLEFKLVLYNLREFFRIVFYDFGCGHRDRHVVLYDEHLAAD